MDVDKDPVGTEIAREEEKRFKVLGETGLPLGGREGEREEGRERGKAHSSKGAKAAIKSIQKTNHGSLETC